MPQQAFQQVREIATDGGTWRADGSKNDVRQEGTVTCSKDDGLKFEWTLYNLARRHWRGVKKDDPVRIRLGYLNGAFGNVLFGTVGEKDSPSTDPSSNDTAYTLRGRDESETRIRNDYWSHTWQSPMVAQVVKDIAGHAGLGIERLDASGTQFKRRFPISQEQSAAHWLKKLKAHADAQSETRHEWFARAGRLTFAPTDQSGGQAVIFKDGPHGNIKAGGIEHSDGKDEKTSGPQSMDFAVVLDPRIEKKGLVSVQAQSNAGIYRISKYKFKTSTEDGTHEATGTMADVSSQYRIKRSNRQNLHGVV